MSGELLSARQASRQLVSALLRPGPAHWSFLSQIIASFSTLLTSILLVRTIGLEAFGQYTVYFIFLVIGKNVISGTVLTPLSNTLARIHAYNLPFYRCFSLAYLLFVSAIVCVATTIAFFALSPIFGWITQSLLPFLGLFLFNALADYFKRFYLATARPAISFLVELIRYGSQLACLVVAGALLSDSLTVQQVLGLLTVANVLACAAGFAFLGRLRWRKRFALAALPSHANFLLWMTPTVFLEAIQGQAPLIVGGAILGEASLGLVNAILSVTNALLLPVLAIQQVLPSAAKAAFRRGGEKELSRTVDRYIYFCLFISVATSILLLLLSDILFRHVLHITGDLLVLVIFMFRNFVMIIRARFTAFYSAIEQPKLIVFNGIVGASLAVILSPILILLLKEPGIALSTLLVGVGVLLQSLRTWQRVKPTDSRE
jgi:Membrane protein involved in the export of O-antigen and teichoic acid